MYVMLIGGEINNTPFAQNALVAKFVPGFVTILQFGVVILSVLCYNEQ